MICILNGKVLPMTNNRNITNLIKLILLYLFIFVFCSCFEEEAKDTIEFTEDIVYTDSLSPPAWEKPLDRPALISGDKDIGIFIKDDVLDPRYRKLLNLITKFIEYSSVNNIKELQTILTAPAFNSFKLRFNDIYFKTNYTLRVKQPDNITQSNFWIEYKILYTDKSYIGSVEVEISGEEYLISDFEIDFFNKIFIPKDNTGD